ncbi:hypothetical protein M2354_003687 [Leclercia adecarboxylata]|jgi:hypothetical protein|uniref:hypothetical protein n=1 Tax=Leclercia adecarboxylata TaxID=83655 RepID=UPI00247414AF|nr:hypothetical protein [Leclercia adecarboxylata]MDH6164032.1 hypothetical protein [Leclercia adecarboxylata]MDU1088926.1 hypothetical protein [Leclercia adecarboxylata]
MTDHSINGSFSLPENTNLRTLTELIAACSPESQQRIKIAADKIIQETRQQILRDALKRS